MTSLPSSGSARWAQSLALNGNNNVKLCKADNTCFFLRRTGVPHCETTMQQKKLVSACAMQNWWLQVGPCWLQRPLFGLREHVAALACIHWPPCLANNLYLVLQALSTV